MKSWSDRKFFISETGRWDLLLQILSDDHKADEFEGFAALGLKLDTVAGSFLAGWRRLLPGHGYQSDFINQIPEGRRKLVMEYKQDNMKGHILNTFLYYFLFL